MHFVNYHCHSHYSNILTPDSIAKVEDYVNRAKELGHKMLFCTQHGGTQGYFDMYNACKKNNIKFGYGAEAYWVKNRFEKDNTNNHIILIAKNNNGRKAINRVLSEANKTGFYYKPRIDLDLINSLPENDVVITTACIGFYGYDNYLEYIDIFNKKFKENFYLEIQPHFTKSQIDKNKELLKISKDKNIKLIAGLDSHYIYEKDFNDRKLFLYSKGIEYEQENGWYMDYCDYKTLFKRFKEQNIFSDEEINNAINATNIFLEFEDFYFDDKKIKLPTLYPDKTQEEKNKILKDILSKEIKNKFGTLNIPKEYSDAIKQEWGVVEKTDMADYFILNYHIIKRGIELGGKITLTSRGSAPSFYICNLLGFTSIDRVNSPIQLFPERFATVDRIKAGSMFDIDFNLSNRPAFIQAQKELLGENHSYFFSSYGKLKEKSAWKMFAKANDISFDISNNITKYISEYENVKKHTEEEDLENIKVQDFIPKEYAEIYNGSLKYQGIVESISPAPCGFLLLQDDIDEEIGVIRVKEELCANIDGLVADKMLYMKNDLLLVTVVDYIYRTFEKIGIEPIVPNELINLSDSKVWDIFKNGQTVCINQCEQEKTKEKVMRYKPKNIQELSAFVAAIRPSFQSMINIFLDRESFSYNIPEFDKLIQTKEIPDSFIIYQEQIMKVLNYAGFEITECYTIMKNIAKKKVGTIEPIMDKFKKGFKEKTNTDNEHIEKVWQIIENSVSYCFNCSHALSVGLDALYGAYLKTYYPLEFYTSVIEIYTEKKDKDKISAIKQEMKLFGINEGDILFGLDNSKITYNKENNTIYPSLTSIKNMNEKTGLELLKLSNNKKYDNFLELIINIKSETTIKKNQLDILIKLDYFKEFGKSKKLIQFIEYFNLIYNAKSPSKEKIPTEIYDIVEKHSEVTNKQFKINNNLVILEEIFNKLQNIDYTISEKISFQLEYLGYITYKNEDIPKEYVYIESIDTKYTPKVKVYCLNTGKSADVKIDKKFYNKNKVEKGDIICILSIKSEAKWIKDGDNFVQSTTEKEWKIHNYERKCL